MNFEYKRESNLSNFMAEISGKPLPRGVPLMICDSFRFIQSCGGKVRKNFTNSVAHDQVGCEPTSVGLLVRLFTNCITEPMGAVDKCAINI